jgi:hypothetical protein
MIAEIYSEMVKFTTTILKFDEQGEKTGWSYINISARLAQRLKPDNKKSFRVKGMLDDHPFNGVALLPMGEGNFIMALNGTIRKAIRKQKGDSLQVQVEVDEKEIKISSELMDCLADEPKALETFNKLTKGHRNYFSNWIESAKTEPTKAKRISHTVWAMLKGFDYGQMIRSLKNDREL